MPDNDNTPKRPGRPAKGAAPMDDAQRQQQYRKRKREAAYAAWDAAGEGKLAQHSTPAVLEAMRMAMEQAAIGRSEADRALASTAVVDLAQELARRYARPNRDSDETQSGLFSTSFD